VQALRTSRPTERQRTPARLLRGALQIRCEAVPKQARKSSFVSVKFLARFRRPAHAAQPNQGESLEAAWARAIIENDLPRAGRVAAIASLRSRTDRLLEDADALRERL
jgi:hypothetical protein